MRVRLLTLILALGLVAAACGDDDAGMTAEGQALADAILADMLADQEPGDEADAGDLRCFTEGMVAELGVARLNALGVTTADVGDPEVAFRGMSDGEMERMADIGMRCIDYEAGFIEAMTADGISQGSAECLTGRLADSDFFRTSFITSMRGVDFSEEQDAALMPIFFDAAGDCLTDEEFATVFGG
jgi:hypothetical protein